MTDVADDALKDALRQRRKYIETNLECVPQATPHFAKSKMLVCIVGCITLCLRSTLTMKACRKLLEEDLGLPEKSLAAHKDFIQQYVDKVW